MLNLFVLILNKDVIAIMIYAHHRGMVIMINGNGSIIIYIMPYRNYPSLKKVRLQFIVD